MKFILDVTFLGEKFEIPITNDNGDLDLWGYSYKLDLPRGFKWHLEFETEDDGLWEVYSIIEDKNDNTVTSYYNECIEYDNAVDDLEDIIKTTFDDFNADIKKRLEEAKQTILLYEDIIKTYNI